MNTIIIACIISVGLSITFLEIKNALTKSAKDINEGLDLLDLESRIESLEAGVKAHVENIRILSGEITKLQVETLKIKNNVNDLSASVVNSTNSIDNFTIFVDKTRGMVDENTKRLNDIQGDVED